MLLNRFRQRTTQVLVSVLFPALLLMAGLSGCASTEVTESPKTAFVPEGTEAKTPAILWTSRTLTQPFDYLGQVKVRSWTYNGALKRLIEGGKELKADALIDVHYEPVGFLTMLHAFAIKFKESP